MRKPGRAVVAALALPFLVGCFGVVPAPIPASPSEREDMNVRGVVVAGDEGRRVQYDEITTVEWTTDQIFISGIGPGPSGQLVDLTERFPLASLESVLVRQIDAAKTSGIIGGLIVGTVAVLSVLFVGTDSRFGEFSVPLSR